MNEERYESRLPEALRDALGWDVHQVSVEELRGGLANVTYQVTRSTDVVALRLNASDTIGDPERFESEVTLLNWAANQDFAPRIRVASPWYLVTEFIHGGRHPLPTELLTPPLRDQALEMLRAFSSAPIKLSRRLLSTEWAKQRMEAVAKRSCPDDEEYLQIGREAVSRVTEWLSDEGTVLVPCHNDFQRKNMFAVGEKLWLFDFQGTSMGLPLTDFAFFVGFNGADNDQKRSLLQSFGVGADSMRRVQLLEFVGRYVAWGFFILYHPQSEHRTRLRAAVRAQLRELDL